VTDLPLKLTPQTYNITRHVVVCYAGASGDFNPIHYSERHAKAMGLPNVIGHGLLTMGIALRAVTDWIGPTAVRSYHARFARPVVVPDTDEGVDLRVAGQVIAQGEKSWTVRLDITVGASPVLSKVTVEVEPPEPLSA
jgi:acyl dehydratase